MKWKVGSDTWKTWSIQVVRGEAAPAVDAFDAGLQERLTGRGAAPAAASPKGPVASGSGTPGAPPKGSPFSPPQEQLPSSASGDGVSPGPATASRETAAPPKNQVTPPAGDLSSFSVSLPLQGPVDVAPADVSSFSVSLPVRSPLPQKDEPRVPDSLRSQAAAPPHSEESTPASEVSAQAEGRNTSEVPARPAPTTDPDPAGAVPAPREKAIPPRAPDVADEGAGVEPTTGAGEATLGSAERGSQRVATAQASAGSGDEQPSSTPAEASASGTLATRKVDSNQRRAAGAFGERDTSAAGGLGGSASSDSRSSASGESRPGTSGELGTARSGESRPGTSGELGTAKSGELGSSASGELGSSASGEFETSASGEFNVVDDDDPDLAGPVPKRGPRVRVVVNSPMAARPGGESTDSPKSAVTMNDAKAGSSPADGGVESDPGRQRLGSGALGPSRSADLMDPIPPPSSARSESRGAPVQAKPALELGRTGSSMSEPTGAAARSVGPNLESGPARAELPTPGSGLGSGPLGPATAERETSGSTLGAGPLGPGRDPAATSATASAPAESGLSPAAEEQTPSTKATVSQDDEQAIALAAEAMFADDDTGGDEADETGLFIPLLTRPREAEAVDEDEDEEFSESSRSDFDEESEESDELTETHGVIEIEDEASVELDTEDIELEGEQPPVPSPPPPADGRSRKAWYDEVFAEHFAALVRPDPEISAERDIDFVLECAPLRSGASVLDVGFGLGFHCFELAKRGFVVSGIDNSLAQVFRTSETREAKGLPLTLLHGDMRDLPTDEAFDLVICLGTTFGYFDDDENLQVLRQFRGRLKKDGRLVLQVFNRDHLVSRLPCRSWWQGLGCLVLDEAEMDYSTSRLHLHRTVAFEDGRQYDHHIYIRAFMLHDLTALLHRAGLRLVEVSGSRETRGRFYGATSSDLWIVAEAAGP